MFYSNVNVQGAPRVCHVLTDVAVMLQPSVSRTHVLSQFSLSVKLLRTFVAEIEEALV